MEGLFEPRGTKQIGVADVQRPPDREICGTNHDHCQQPDDDAAQVRQAADEQQTANRAERTRDVGEREHHDREVGVIIPRRVHHHAVSDHHRTGEQKETPAAEEERFLEAIKHEARIAHWQRHQIRRFLRRVETAVENDTRRENQHHLQRHEEQRKDELHGLRVILRAGRANIVDDEFEAAVEQRKQSDPKHQAQPDDQRRPQAGVLEQIAQLRLANSPTELEKDLSFALLRRQTLAFVRLLSSGGEGDFRHD